MLDAKMPTLKDRIAGQAVEAKIVEVVKEEVEAKEVKKGGRIKK